MMINKRLISTVSESKKYIVGNVICQWLSLAANIGMMICITGFLEKLFEKQARSEDFLLTLVIVVAAAAVRFVCTTLASRMSYLSSKSVKKTLREMIYRKLLRLGTYYKEQVKTSEVVQVAVEGVDQLETYFGAYLPQFFYAMHAPVTLFLVLSFVNFPSAVLLLVCVPLIPVSIAAVQRWAKKLLSKYWGQYTALGDTFLENLQGLTALKIYQADEFKQEEMKEEAEKFRKITMKVLTMQLNSITIMDLIAYGGAALGVILAVSQYRRGEVTLAGALLIILLAADFFIPMRLLGSFFHIAMNGMAASDKIFKLLDLPETELQVGVVPENCSIVCTNLHFSYEKDREILQGVDLKVPKGSFTSIVGESGCGKSTIASILMGRNKGYRGSVTIGGAELSSLSEMSLMEHVTYISHQSYLFKGTVRENLAMGDCAASEETMWKVLERVNLASFLRSEQGLETMLSEKASNLSGGQCQRLALARALLHDSPIYLFDEATSNIDMESENDIMREIHALAKEKTVILISHRLANVTDSDQIYVMEDGKIAECGTHEALLTADGQYARLWKMQQSLENYGKVTFSGAAAEGVTFSYGGETILDDVSLKIEKGSVVGIMGRSGSGKSTFLKLLMRFWDVQTVSMKLSGTDIKEINTSNLRECESFVTQETHLFHDSIRNNLRIAKLDATEEEIINACKKASVHTFITSLPQGYDTPVGELGDILSGGERQRIGLVRAFLHQADLMLLDEPTSNLDSLNEAIILRSLKEEREEKTVVLVSHRPSTMRIADRIYSVEHGRMS